MRAPIAHIPSRVLAQRRVHVGYVPVQLEACWCDADNGVALLVENNRCAERLPSIGEVALPETVAQDHHGRGSDAVLFGQEGAALREIYAQNGKQAGRDLAEVDVLRFSRLANRASVVERPGHLERAAASLTIEKIRVGDILFAVYFGFPRITMAVHDDQLVRLWVRQRLQEHAVDYREHHCRCTAAKSKG